MRAVVHDGAGAFLRRAQAWLELAEDENNLVLGLAAALAEAPAPPPGPEAYFFATVEDAGDVVGCAFRTPPHKLVLTRMPLEAVPGLVDEVAMRYPEVPATLGPADVATAAADAWVARRGGSAHPGMRMRIHRLDRVVSPEGVPGAMRTAERTDLPVAHAWGDGFADETGSSFRQEDAVRAGWVRERRLHLWEDDGVPVSMAVHTGATRRGVRVGYVYTPPERRRRGYASALVAALSAELLASGFAFCVLYTDLANPTSNAIYARVGYRPVCDVEDVLIEAETGSEVPRPTA